ncbi:MAG TPA: DNA gyrase C-terminal beta-propeller domain-containing protein, partial [Pirellulaceae bacterium]|nr:DNA gyrase C-terminal beta-propeller domain-containing protein [Pirellulaceae bacterium]
ARPMGRNTSGVKGIRLGKDDDLVGMVVADPDSTLLTACENGYGKRTNFGPSMAVAEEEGEVAEDVTEATGSEEEDEVSSSSRYRTQRRGGKGVRDIKTTKRNGKVIGIARVTDDDELMMMTARGKIQRVAAREISVIGRNTQGVRIMSLDDDKLAAIVRVPRDEDDEEEVGEEKASEPTGAASDVPESTSDQAGSEE